MKEYKKASVMDLKTEKGKMNPRTWWIFAALLIAFINLFFLPKGTSLAAETKAPKSPANRNIDSRGSSFLEPVGTGYMMGYVEEGALYIQYLNSSFEVTEEKSLPLELPNWGGFYAGADAYYVALGDSSASSEEPSFRVIKYDRNWDRLGAADFYNNETMDYRRPSVKEGMDMTEQGGKLYLALGYAGYYYGEGRMLLEVDEEEMTGKKLSSSESYIFSTSRHLAVSGNTIYFLEKNGKDRRALLVTYDGENETETALLTYGGTNTSSYSVRNCYASVDGIEVSDTHILTVGTSIDQSGYDEVEYTTAHNVYLTVTPKDNISAGATELFWLTDHKDDETCFSGLEILKVSDDRYLIMWQEFEENSGNNIDPDSKGKFLHFCYVDGSGAVIGEDKTLKAAMSAARPVLSGTEVIWYASSGNKVTFYRLDTEKDEIKKTEFHSAGDGITWTIDDGTMTFTGEGVVSAGEYYSIMPLSSYYTYSSGGNRSIWSDLEEPVKKMVFSEGITGIAENEFRDIGTIEEVEIPSTMESIGSGAFVWCDDIRKVLFKSSTCVIGEDAFWSGWYYYNDDKAYYATFVCEEGSTADVYATENGARTRYILLDEDHNLFVGAQKINGEWKVFGEDGLLLQYPWGMEKVAGKTYYFDDDYKLCTGWQEVDGDWYHFSEVAAAMDTGFLKDGKKTYYLDEDGRMATRWKKVGEDYYFFGNDGAMQTGWIRVVGRYFYLKADGKMHTGWFTEKGKTYYMNEDGVMMTGTVVIDGETCIFAKNGVLITRSSEAVPNGWKKMVDQWAFFRNGERLTGWQKIGGKYYYFELDGIMTTGWRYLKTKWYYLDPVSGAMKTGWLKLDGKWYFFDPSGYMVTGTRTIRGKKYEFAKNGECLNP